MAKQSDLKDANTLKQKMLQDLFQFEQETGLDSDISLTDKRDLVVAPPKPDKNFSNPDGIVDIITFCEHPYFLGLKLTPWQRLICKAFYSGTHGNTHLQIELDKPESGCEGCIWKYHYDIEVNYIKQMQQQNRKLRPEEPSIKPENSPCLQCSRYNSENRKFYYEFQMSQALNNKAKGEVENYSKREIFDLHTNEMEMLNSEEISEKVRQQIIDKWGAKFQELILVLGRRSGKMIWTETPIYTPKGWSKMGELEVGDYVFAPDGTKTKIIAKSDTNYDEQAYELVFSNGDKIYAGENHEWVTLTKAERKNASRGKYSKAPKPQIFTTKQIHETLTYGTPRHMLKKGTQTERREKLTVEYNHAIEITKPLIFDKQDLTIHPYLLGAWLGDGTRSTNQITGIDLEIFDYIQLNCNHEINHSKHIQKSHSITKHSITGESFVSLLKQINLYKNKHIPDIYKHSSIEQRMELLRGLNDTDGYADPKKYAIEFCNTNETLAYDYYELVCGLGYKAVIKKSDATLYGRKTSDRWRITYSVRPGDKVFNLSRKQSVLDNKTKIDKSDKYRIFIKECNPVKNPGMQCIQVDHPSSMYLCGRSMIPTHNSFMVSVIALYEVYRFLEMEHPQARFPLTEFDTISIVNIANSQKQAKGAIFDKMRSYCFKSPYFSAAVGKDIQGEIHFLTPHDKKENERRIAQGNSSLLTGTIQAISGHSNSSTLVGLTVAVVIIDEMAEMAGNNPDGNADEILYDKLKPALATFGADGKMICISNPLGPMGKFHSLYETSFDDPATLMFQLPTWLSNPTISKSWLDSEKAKSRKTFNIFYGAQFSSGAGDTFLNEDDVMRAFRSLSDVRRLEHGEPLQKYYMHLDPAHSSDFYTLAIVHAIPMVGEFGSDGKELLKIVIDHIHYWEPKGPNQPVNQDEVDAYILRLAQRFNLVQVTYDQHWSSHASITRMKQNGVPCHLTPYTGQFQREIYQNLYELFVNSRIEFYGMNTMSCEMPNGNIISLKEATLAREQLLDLQRKYRGGGWKIEAPRGQKDDIPDCIAGAAFQAMKDKVFSILPKPRSISFNPWRQRI